MNNKTFHALLVGTPLAFIFAFFAVVYAYGMYQEYVDARSEKDGAIVKNKSAQESSTPSSEVNLDNQQDNSLQASQSPSDNTTNSQSKNSSSPLTQWDIDGCQIGSASYEVCRKNVFNAQCSAEWSAINDRYNGEVDRGWAVRDKYKQDTERDLSASSLPESEKISVRFRASVIAQDMANKIIDPAYLRYVDELAGLKNKQCEFYTQGYPNYANHAMDHYLNL